MEIKFPQVVKIVISDEKYKQMLDDIKLADISKAGSFLDGCKVSFLFFNE